MTQLWPALTGSLGDAVETHLPNRTESLRTLHAGPNPPSSTAAYMWWADTTHAVLWMRNSSNTDWIAVGTLGVELGREVHNVERIASVSGSTSFYLPIPWRNCRVVRAVILTATATSGSDGSNNWTLNIQNLSAGSVNLHSTGKSTTDEEFAALTPWVFTPDQNEDVDAGQVLLVNFAKTGSPTSPLLGWSFQVEFGARTPTLA